MRFRGYTVGFQFVKFHVVQRVGKRGNSNVGRQEQYTKKFNRIFLMAILRAVRFQALTQTARRKNG